MALQHEIHVFSFPIPTRRLLTLDTKDNPKGLVEIATMATAQKQLLAFPGHKTGSVQLVDLAAMESGSSSAPVTLVAHQVYIGSQKFVKVFPIVSTINIYYNFVAERFGVSGSQREWNNGSYCLCARNTGQSVGQYTQDFVDRIEKGR